MIAGMLYSLDPQSWTPYPFAPCRLRIPPSTPLTRHGGIGKVRIVGALNFRVQCFLWSYSYISELAPKYWIKHYPGRFQADMSLLKSIARRKAIYDVLPQASKGMLLRLQLFYRSHLLGCLPFNHQRPTDAPHPDRVH